MNFIYSERFWTPIIGIYSASFFCGREKPYPQTKFRPPAILFKIVWPILCIFIGISWYNSISQKYLDIIHGIITFLLIIWIIFFRCNNNKIFGWYIIAITISAVILAISIHKDIISKTLLTLLLAWLLIAFQLNYDIIT